LDFSWQSDASRDGRTHIRNMIQDIPKGVRHIPGYLDRDAQETLVEDIRKVVQAAPLYVPAMPRTGKEMSVRMTNCGSLGWVTDKERGYRYQPTHPVTGEPWPPIPDALLRLWQEVAGYPHRPEACLVNVYTDAAKMGLHQDRDELDLAAPVLSVSLGDDCLFRVGQTSRDGQTKSFRLRSGDLVVLGGEGLSGHLDALEEWRPHQPDAETGHAS
jgi:alkylated DNA repair protein (DNA oxidative demethylase)